MHELTLSTEQNTGLTTVSNIFIDKYMPQANGEFVKVYLYLLRCVGNQLQGLSVSSLADTFNQTEADVMRALRYWNKIGVVSLGFSGPNDELSNITFCDLGQSTAQKSISAGHSDTASPSLSQHAEVSRSSASAHTSVATKSHDNVTPIIIETKNSFPVKPVYTPAQITELSSQEDLKLLLYVVSTYFGKTLSSTEASTIIYFYDTLNFPADLIEYLVEYCVSRDHKSMRYIETVALDWADSGITTVKAAKEQVLSHNEAAYSVMNAFGLTNQALAPAQLDFVAKWTNEYNFSSEIIIEACNRTIRAINKPSFQYADSILAGWKKAHVQNIDDIKKTDAEYEQSKPAKKASSNVISKSSNRFNNFEQRDVDGDELEQFLLKTNG